ncbi:hypothetical protein GOP47_0017657 [Adiantum capillus-veneris]|uniref:Two-component response regulator n=1 Tax=Adiantum capillus-veneris TaxID=13818 RepID=A0A9D4UFU0_ADICA|nr:hypothetical protein GOP47_0017657 [Adiantum capillus-veneris]
MWTVDCGVWTPPHSAVLDSATSFGFSFLSLFVCLFAFLWALPPPSKAYSSRMDTFSPIGLHVLVVDDDPLCLLALERMLKQCSYKDVLRDSEEAVDLVLSDVYMPDVDGFKLLEIIGLELDLPVIMMSANGDTGVVMKGITHGACDYLIKPVRIEELRNVWQHVVRRKGTDSPTNSGPSCGDNNEVSSLCGSTENLSKKRKEVSVMGENMHNIEDVSNLKRARVNWTPDLHQRFVNAVNQLGVDKSAPKKVLDVMSVKGLTRENVASHLQKYRLYLKRLSGVTPEPCPIASFQASKGGQSGGTMRIMPGGKSSSLTSATKGLSLCRSSLGAQSLDVKAMNLPQFKAANDQKQRQMNANRAQVLQALGFVESHPDRNASFDMHAYVPKNHLLSSLSMPSENALSASQPRQQYDNEVGLKPFSAQVEGFVSNWNIKPTTSRVCAAASSMQVHGNYNTINSENKRDDCSNLEMQTSDNIDIRIADMFCYTPMEGFVFLTTRVYILKVLKDEEGQLQVTKVVPRHLELLQQGFGFEGVLFTKFAAPTLCLR